jgi:hypothetical protein
MPTANVLKRKRGVIGATSAKFESPLKSDNRQCEMSEGTAAKTWPGRNRLDQVTKPDENSAAERCRERVAVFHAQFVGCANAVGMADVELTQFDSARRLSGEDYRIEHAAPLCNLRSGKCQTAGQQSTGGSVAMAWP